MKCNLLLALVFILERTVVAYGQTTKTYYPAWTFQQKNITVNGLSFGLGSVRKEPLYTNTNGLKVELIGVGFYLPFILHSSVAQDDSSFEYYRNQPVSEHINGMSLSLTGTNCNCITKGISAGLIVQYNYSLNGLSFSLLMNSAQVHNGVQFSMINESYVMKGLQFGLFNQSHKLRGVQIGLINKNEKRTSAIINWNFSD
jgi:hypothetical protein